MAVYFGEARLQTDENSWVCPTNVWACAKEISWVNVGELDAGAILSVLIGAAFGAFAAKLVLGLFRRSMNPKTALVSAQPPRSDSARIAESMNG